MIKAVLFDMDGVLYDSMPFHICAWSEISAKHHLDYVPEDFYLLEGCTGEYTINLLYQRTYGRNATAEEIKILYREKANLFTKYNDGNPMHGVADVLKQVKDLGTQTLVVTGSGQKSLIDKLETDFPGHFKREKMVTAFDVKRGKPDPEPYLMGLVKAGVSAGEAIVVENAPMGVQSARAADIFTIAVNTGPLPDQVLRDAGANLLFPDMPSLAKSFQEIIKAR
ncbi:beta-phosphoglucomutase [Bacteroidia bacterium]|nr:beta-phosphoglucomutase [Bacteroidia bacterium]GHU76245.1 beta-phosphoglucomutase [Bacteroidia bacterium]